MTVDPVAFAEARLNEDEEEAKAASFGEDGAPWSDAVPGMVHIDADWISREWSRSTLRAYVAGSDTDIYRRHIARHDPARALREVEIKRGILAEHPPETGFDGESLDGPICQRCGDRCYDGGFEGDPYPCRTVRLVLSSWPEHPDYDQTWKP